MENMINEMIGDIEFIINQDEKRCLILAPSYKLGLEPTQGKIKLLSSDYNKLIKSFGYEFDRVLLNNDKVALFFSYGDITIDGCYKVLTSVINNINRAYMKYKEENGINDELSDEPLRIEGKKKRRVIKEDKQQRYVVTVDYYLYADNDRMALEVAKNSVPEFLGDDLFSGKIVEIGEQPFGQIGVYRKLNIEGKEIVKDVLMESFRRSLNERLGSDDYLRYIGLANNLNDKYGFDINRVISEYNEYEIELIDYEELTYKLENEYEFDNEMLIVKILGQYGYDQSCELTLVQEDGGEEINVDNCFYYLSDDAKRNLEKISKKFIEQVKTKESDIYPVGQY